MGKSTNGYNFSALFYAKILRESKSRHIPFYLVYFPEFREFGTDDIWLNVPLLSTLPSSQPVIGLSSKELFGEAPKERTKKFFRDDLHLSKNGAELYCRAVMPTLFRKYRAAAKEKANAGL